MLSATAQDEPGVAPKHVAGRFMEIRWEIRKGYLAFGVRIEKPSSSTLLEFDAIRQQIRDELVSVWPGGFSLQPSETCTTIYIHPGKSFASGFVDYVLETDPCLVCAFATRATRAFIAKNSYAEELLEQNVKDEFAFIQFRVGPKSDDPSPKAVDSVENVALCRKQGVKREPIVLRSASRRTRVKYA